MSSHSEDEVARLELLQPGHLVTQKPRSAPRAIEQLRLRPRSQLAVRRRRAVHFPRLHPIDGGPTVAPNPEPLGGGIEREPEQWRAVRAKQGDPAVRAVEPCRVGLRGRREARSVDLTKGIAQTVDR